MCESNADRRIAACSKYINAVVGIDIHPLWNVAYQSHYEPGQTDEPKQRTMKLSVAPSAITFVEMEIG